MGSNLAQTTEDSSDAQLVAEYLRGDKEALQILISRHLKMIYNFVYRYVCNAHDTEDLTQDIFIKTWRNLKKFDQTRSFKTWIFKIAQNTCLDFLRKKKTVPFCEFENEEGENPMAESLADPAPLPQEIFDRENLARELSLATEKLPPKYRAVLFLHYNDHLTFQEISESLGEPLDTVKSRHRRAIIALRKILTEH